MSEQFPIDWNEWRQEWQGWRAEKLDGVKRSTFPWPKKNFLADEVLGAWQINGREVELSEVTFPDFSNRYGPHLRYVGVTFGVNGQTEAGPVVQSFAELESVLFGDD